MNRRRPLTDKATRPDLLRRVEATDLTDGAAEKAAGLPQGFLSRAKAGGNAGTRAAATWEKLRAWLDARGGAPASAPAQRTVAVLPAEGDAFDRLIAEASTTTSFERLDAVAAEILRASLRTLDPVRARVMIEVLKERRQLLKAIDQQRARLDARKPLQVTVKLVGEWAEKIKANQAREAELG